MCPLPPKQCFSYQVKMSDYIHPVCSIATHEFPLLFAPELNTYENKALSEFRPFKVILL